MGAGIWEDVPGCFPGVAAGDRTLLRPPDEPGSLADRVRRSQRPGEAARRQRLLVATCIELPSRVRRADGTLDCEAALRRRSPTGAVVEQAIPACAAAPSDLPCWRIAPTESCGPALRVCWDAACSPGLTPPDVVSGLISCGVQ